MNPDPIIHYAAGIALLALAGVTALAVVTGRATAREGAETLRQLAVVRTRLGALVTQVERERRTGR